jgi:Icc-related predicted phosphoesterase
MKLLILSDLHLEHGSRWAIPGQFPPYDVAIFAGDIAGSPREAVHILAATPVLAGRPLIYVPGNHEFYGDEIETRLAVGRAVAADMNIGLLDRSSAVVDGVRFIGATLWTDYGLFGEELRDDCMAAAARWLSDHRLIKRRGDNGSVLFKPSDALARHRDDLEFIASELAAPFAGKTVVVTHHGPHPLSVVAQFKNDMLTPAFVSDLTATIECGKPELWVHGHTHASFDYRVADTRIVCNPKGYGPSRLGQKPENAVFDDGLVLEI